MANTSTAPSTIDDSKASRWQTLASHVLAGKSLSHAEAGEILAAPDEDVLDLLQAAYRVRRHFFGKKVQLY
ncbi:MAG: biotin synthase BioB, partial [Pirellulales bacterium]|nr:biotin synthase BioB [Pirellulales bacterium]